MIAVRRHAHWLKLAVLALLAWFVASRVDLGDRVHFPEAVDRHRPLESIELPVGPGETLTLREGEDLPVELVQGDGGAVEAWIRVGDRSVLLDPGLVDEDGPLQVQAGLLSSLRSVAVGPLVVALVLYLPVNLLLALRWGVLLRAVGIVIGWRAILRLTWIGLFFNTVVPGGAGGDVVKLIELGSYTERQSEALGTIVVDRVIGLMVLVALGATASLAIGEGGSELAWIVAAFGFVLLALGFAYTSEILRSRLDVRSLLGRLPLGSKLQRLDQSVMSMRRSPAALAGAVGLSLVVQLVGFAAFLQAARALGIHEATYLDMARTAPVALAANALPISPGGLGLLEVAFQELMHRQGLSTLAAGFMLGVLVRFLLVVASLPGLPLWLVARPGRAGSAGFRASEQAAAGGGRR